MGRVLPRFFSMVFSMVSFSFSVFVFFVCVFLGVALFEGLKYRSYFCVYYFF